MDDVMLAKLEETILANQGLLFPDIIKVLHGDNPPQNVVNHIRGYMRMLPARGVVWQDRETKKWYGVSGAQPEEKHEPTTAVKAKSVSDDDLDQLRLLGLREVWSGDVTLLPIYAGIASRMRISTQYIEFEEGIAWVGDSGNPDSGKWTGVSQINGSNMYLSELPPDFPAFQYRNLFLKVAIPKRKGSLEARVVVYELGRKNWKIWVGVL